MSFDVPVHIEPQVQQFAAAQHISHDEAIIRLIQAGLASVSHPATNPRRSYASFFGVAKGRPGAHGAPEAADKYVEELRNEW